jgi:putative drug exporter of the RND superfamily
VITPLARFAVRRPVAVLIGWALVVVVLAAIGRGVEDKLLPTQLLVPGTESDRWDKLREGHFGEDAAVLLTGPKDQIDRQGPVIYRELARREHTRAISPWSGGRNAKELRPSPGEALIVLDLEVPPGGTQSTIIAPVERFVDQRVRPPVEWHLSGNAPLGRDMNEATTDSIHRAELITFPILILVLLLVFRTPVAAGIPLLIALGTTQAGFGVIALIAEFADLDAIALSLASMIGLALGVDYSLLIVTRFREGLDAGRPVRQAASLAANTAGRTAIFAGVVLIAIMLVSFFLSPGSVLLSSAVGAIVVTLLSMAGAALVAPAAVTLLGERVNSFYIGRGDRPQTERAGLIGAFVGRVVKRPALAAASVLAALLLVAAPVSAIETIPPDPRQLPDGSKGLEDFDAVKDAGFGPTVDIVMQTPSGTLTDQRRLDQIKAFEQRLRRIEHVKTVVGPSTVGEQTKELRDAPRSIKKGKKQLRRARRDLARLERGLGDASAGVKELRAGLLEAAGGSQELASGSERARQGAGELAGGADRASAGANQLAAGGREAGQGADSLLDGLNQAEEGAGQIADGATEARQGSQRLADGSATLRDGLNNELVPGADSLATGLRQGQVRLNALRLPARATEDQLRALNSTLDQMTVGRTDPVYLQAVAQARIALGAATGSNPVGGGGEPAIPGYNGLEASIAEAADQSGTAADGASALSAGARRAANGADELNTGANDLTAGLRDLETGARRLESGLGDARDEVASSASGLDQLAAGSSRLARGVGALSDGANELEGGIGRIADGNQRLAGELGEGARRSAPLESGLDEMHASVAQVRRQLVRQTGPFKPLRSLDRLERQSPGFFGSGYVTVAALDGSRPIDRESSLFLVDAEHGGDVGRVQVRPDVPPNDPRTERVLDNVRDATTEFADSTGMAAAAGGPAGQLVDYDRATSGRFPLLIFFISLVTYLMLVPILRSLVLPAVAVGLNLVTVAAGFGVLTLLFVGDNPLLGGAGALDAITIAGIFSITFALSIDYQVFLLTRMREEFVRTQSANQAIEFGIQKTAKVVTGAAAIMIAVFVAFALADFVIIKQFGIGLATAVLIDATIVRLALLPALLRLLGERAWYMPAWLDDRLPVLDVEGSEFAHEVEHMARA